MTNDYKDKLLKYLTGNIAQGVSSATPYYKEAFSYENPEAISGLYTTYNVKGVLYCKDNKGVSSGKILVYGNGTNDNENWHGFIQVFDNTYHLLHTFKEFASGTLFGVFEVLNIDEQGQVFGIDYNNYQHRLILLNNVSEKGTMPNYQCILRQSYYLQGDITNTYCFLDDSNMLCVEKSKQSALYFMSGLDGGRDLLYACSFRINVGSDNEWTEYTDGVVYRGQFVDSYVYFDEDDNISCNLYFEETNINDDTHEITRTYNSGTSFTGYEVLIPNLEQYIPNIEKVTGLAIEEKKIYVGIGGHDNVGPMTKTYFYDNGGMYYVDGTTYQSTFPIDTYPNVQFTLVDNKVFTCTYTTTNVSGGNSIGYIILNLIDEEGIDYSYTIDKEFYYNDVPAFAVSKNFNKYTMLYSNYPLDTTPYVFTTYMCTIINRNGYNGEEKESIESLLPKQGILKNSQGRLIFARDLYNSKTYNDRTISTLNVPNTYLNDTEISNEILVSDTNTNLVDNTTYIEKNIYEDLYINFNNQIKMQNRNFENNYIDNQGGAIRLNQSSSKVLDYENARATKVRVTYSDTTSYITSANNSITDNICTYQIGVHVPSGKTIESVEIISDDELTIYQTISNLGFLLPNNYYIIEQDVHIE